MSKSNENEVSEERVEKLTEQMKNLEKTRNIFKLISVAVFGLPIITLILIFTLVSHGIVNINNAFKIARIVLIIMAAGNIILSALYFFRRDDKSKKKGIILLPLSFVYIFVVVYLSFMLPVKFIDYSKYDIVSVGGMDIPTIHKYTGHEGILVSFKTNKETEIGNEHKVGCNVELIYVFYSENNVISDDEVERYVREMEQNGFKTSVKEDENGKKHTICYIYNEEQNYILYSICDGYSMLYSKVTSSNKLPSESELLGSI